MARHSAVAIHPRSDCGSARCTHLQAQRPSECRRCLLGRFGDTGAYQVLHRQASGAPSWVGQSTPMESQIESVAGCSGTRSSTLGCRLRSPCCCSSCCTRRPCTCCTCPWCTCSRARSWARTREARASVRDRQMHPQRGPWLSSSLAPSEAPGCDRQMHPQRGPWLSSSLAPSEAPG